jgi:hypothetical protein
MTVNHIAPVHEGPARPGRPSTYNEEAAERVLDRVAETNESLRDICKLPGMPKATTLQRWRDTHPEFDRLMRSIMEARCADLLMEGLEIADNGDRDWRPETNEDGVITLNADREHLIRTKQRLDWRLTLAKNLAPKAPAQGPQSAPNAVAPGVDGALLLDQRVLEGHQLRPSYSAYERALAERR